MAAATPGRAGSARPTQRPQLALPVTCHTQTVCSLEQHNPSCRNSTSVVQLHGLPASNLDDAQPPATAARRPVAHSLCCTMAPSARLLASLLLMAAAAGPAAGSRARALDRLLQEGGSPESSGADGAENTPQPIGVIQGPTYSAAADSASGAAAGPSAETPSSPYRFADVGSGSAADVQAAIAAGDAAGFASAAAAAGPEAAGRCVAMKAAVASCRHAAAPAASMPPPAMPCSYRSTGPSP